MGITVRIPTGMRTLTCNKAEVSASGSNLLELIGFLEKEFPGMKERILDESGKKRRFINIYVNNEDMRFLQKEETPLKDNDIVDIISAIAGG